MYLCIFKYTCFFFLSKTNALAVEEDELQSLSDHSPVPHHETSKMTGAGVDFFVPEVP